MTATWRRLRQKLKKKTPSSTKRARAGRCRGVRLLPSEETTATKGSMLVALIRDMLLVVLGNKARALGTVPRQQQRPAIAASDFSLMVILAPD